MPDGGVKYGGRSLRQRERREAYRLLRTVPLFTHASTDLLTSLVDEMSVMRRHKGSFLIDQGDPQRSLYLIASGDIVRIKREEDGTEHWLEDHGRKHFGSLHLTREDPSYAMLYCHSDVKAYRLPASAFRELVLRTDERGKKYAEEVIYSLSKSLRSMMRTEKTPLLDQKGGKIPLSATAVAATFESFFRSALNALMNQALTSTKKGATKIEYFPQMHIQVPSRVLYICGFKGLRQAFENKIEVADMYSHPILMRLGFVCAPGIIMSPISSILEATNAGHVNREPLLRRASRGFTFRILREVIFGVGLNQLSDFCEERVPRTGPLKDSAALRNAVGSIGAGVTVGYFSHIPHLLSTKKLLNPRVSYLGHLADLVEHADKTRIAPTVKDVAVRRLMATGLTLFAPTGMMIRTTQIVGSFIILNGTIHALQRYEGKHRH
eukprot:Clim_evm7s224 gene=Clim_evmTU7s224